LAPWGGLDVDLAHGVFGPWGGVGPCSWGMALRGRGDLALRGFLPPRGGSGMHLAHGGF